MYYAKGRIVSYNRPGDKVYSPRSARVKIFSNEEEYKQHQVDDQLLHKLENIENLSDW